jgi:recombination protein RecA
MAKDKEEKASIKDLDSLISSMQKKYGAGSVSIYGKNRVVVEWVPISSFYLTELLGNGYPRGRMIEIYGPESSGKAQPLSCSVLTPKGFVSMGSVKIGDFVIDGNGAPTKVIGVFPQGVKDVYKVSFSDGTFTFATEDHLWKIDWHEESKEKRAVLSTGDIIRAGFCKNKGRGHLYLAGVSTPQVSFDYQDIPLDPYLMGVFLGGGSLSGRNCGISLYEKDVRDKVNSLLAKYSCELHVHGDPEKHFYHPVCAGGLANQVRKTGKGLVKNSLKKIFKDFGLDCLLANKHIPKEYLVNSVEVRVALLQGLMDTDGYVSKSGEMSLTTNSEQMSNDIAFLSRSLGCIDTICRKHGRYEKDSIYVECYDSFTHFIRPPTGMTIVTSGKHLSRQISFRTDYPKSIRAIEPARREECRCIKVDSLDNTYLTDDFIKTHNTTLACYLAGQCQKHYFEDKKRNGVVAYIDVEHALDPAYAKVFGLDMDKVIFSQPDSAEQALDIVEDLVESDMVDMIVLDSVAALSPQAELDGEMGDNQMGLLARLMGKACRKLQSAMKPKSPTVVFINQIRYKMIAYGNPETCPGGNALKFFAAIRIVTRPGDAIEDKDGIQIGMISRVKSIKNKVSSPHRNCEMKILFASGYQIEEEYVLAFQKHGIIKKAGGWFSIPVGDGDPEKIQGAERVIEWLRVHPVVYDDFKAKLQSAMSRKTTSVVVEANDEDENAIVAEQVKLEQEVMDETDISPEDLAKDAVGQ